MINPAENTKKSPNDADSALLEETYQLALRCYEAEDWPNALKWLTEVAKRVPIYKNVKALLEDTQKQLELAVLYEQGQEAFNAKDWGTARDRFQAILDIDSGYKNAQDLYRDAHKGVELPILYSQALEQYHNQDWDGALESLSTILNLDSKYKDASGLLEEVRQHTTLEQAYQWALKQYEQAEKTKIEEDWRKAAALLQEIAHKEPGYKSVSSRLAHAKRRLELFELYRKGMEHYASQDWQQAVLYLRQAADIESRDPNLTATLAEAREKLREQEAARYQEMLELYNRGSELYRRGKWKDAVVYLADASVFEPNHADLPIKLAEARKKLRQQHIIKIWGTLTVVFTIVIAMIWLEIGVNLTSTGTIPNVDRIEVWMDGNQLNQGKLPVLASGGPVELEVIVFDTNGKRYMSDDLVCTWSIVPLGDEDLGINTDLCKTLYIPSQTHSTQTIVIEVEGLEKQFEPGDSISLEFNIIQS